MPKVELIDRNKVLPWFEGYMADDEVFTIYVCNVLKEQNVVNASPVSVIDEMIAELKQEKDDVNRIITHSITALELLKARWERMSGETVENEVENPNV